MRGLNLVSVLLTLTLTSAKSRTTTKAPATTPITYSEVVVPSTDLTSASTDVGESEKYPNNGVDPKNINISWSWLDELIPEASGQAAHFMTQFYLNVEELQSNSKKTKKDSNPKADKDVTVEEPQPTYFNFGNGGGIIVKPEGYTIGFGGGGGVNFLSEAPAVPSYNDYIPEAYRPKGPNGYAGQYGPSAQPGSDDLVGRKLVYKALGASLDNKKLYAGGQPQPEDPSEKFVVVSILSTDVECLKGENVDSKRKGDPEDVDLPTGVDGESKHDKKHLKTPKVSKKDKRSSEKEGLCGGDKKWEIRTHCVSVNIKKDKIKSEIIVVPKEAKGFSTSSKEDCFNRLERLSNELKPYCAKKSHHHTEPVRIADSFNFQFVPGLTDGMATHYTAKVSCKK